MSSYRHKSFVSSKKRKLIVKHLTLQDITSPFKLKDRCMYP